MYYLYVKFENGEEGYFEKLDPDGDGLWTVETTSNAWCTRSFFKAKYQLGYVEGTCDDCGIVKIEVVKR